MIPTENSAWPPAELEHLFAPITTWAVWYEGDTGKLADLYSGNTTIRPSQLSGGVVGRIARWFWGQPVPAGQSKAKTHIPIARDIARASATLLFGEELHVDVAADAAKPKQNPLQDRLNVILDGNRWQSLLPEAGEFCSALGGVYLRCGWDAAVAQHPLISVVQPDGAIPTFTWGRLTEVTFWQVVRKEGSTVWRHLETHQPGRIVHQLYQGTQSNIGTVVPLTEARQTADLPVNAESAIETGTPLLTAVYVPNVKPAPLWRGDPIGQHLGASDLAGLEGRMDELDEAWTNLRREGRLNKSRILAASSLLENLGPGQGAAFDLDREVFAPMHSPADAPALQVTLAPSTLSVDDRLKEIDAIVRDIYSNAGYSPATFGMDGEVAATATEVAARERKTMSTREMKTRYWTAALEDFLEAVTAIDKAVFNQGQQVRPRVTFSASVSPTITETATTAQLLNTAQAASTETRVRLVHPDWDDTQVQAEVVRIMAEQNMGTPTVTLTDPTAGLEQAVTQA